MRRLTLLMDVAIARYFSRQMPGQQMPGLSG